MFAQVGDYMINEYTDKFDFYQPNWTRLPTNTPTQTPTNTYTPTVTQTPTQTPTETETPTPEPTHAWDLQAVLDSGDEATHDGGLTIFSDGTDSPEMTVLSSESNGLIWGYSVNEIYPSGFGHMLQYGGDDFVFAGGEGVDDIRLHAHDLYYSGILNYVGPTYTPTQTPTITPTNTPTSTPTQTPTVTQTPTNTPTETPVPAATIIAHVDLTDMPSSSVADHDGRYYTESEVDAQFTAIPTQIPEADTLDSVTDRGATTTNDITVGDIAVNGDNINCDGDLTITSAGSDTIITASASNNSALTVRPGAGNWVAGSLYLYANNGSGVAGPACTLGSYANGSFVMNDEGYGDVLFFPGAFQGSGLCKDLIIYGDAEEVGTSLGMETDDDFTIFNNTGNIDLLPTGGTVYVGDDIYINDNCSALSFTDRSSYFEGDALAAIANIKPVVGSISIDGFRELDKGSMPKGTTKLIETKTATGVVMVEERGIGETESVLVRAIQQLIERLEALEKL